MKASRRKPIPLNTTQLDALRAAAFEDPVGRVHSDRCTGKALVARGFAREAKDGKFWITDAGLVRAKKKADVVAKRDGQPLDPSLLEDLP